MPGDIVQLDVGRVVPADGRLIEVTDFRTDEAALTGESLPVTKRGDELLEEGTPLADRTNMVYKGTTAVAGTALAVVTETGAATEIGRIGRLVGAIEEGPTPLERRLDELGRRLVWLALCIAALVAALGAWQGAPLGLVVKMGIALAVAAVPEALPAVATIALAVGVHRWRGGARSCGACPRSKRLGLRPSSAQTRHDAHVGSDDADTAVDGRAFFELRDESPRENL